MGPSFSGYYGEDREVKTSHIVGRWAMIFVMGVSLALGLRWVYDYATVDHRYPIKISSVEVLNSPIKEGQNVVARVYRDKVRNDCLLNAKHSAQNQDGKIFRLLQSYALTPEEQGAVSADYFDVEYTTSNFPPGFYTMVPYVEYHCDGQVFVPPHPTFNFRVVK